MIHLQVIDDPVWKGFVDQIKIVQNDSNEVIFSHPRNSLITMLIEVSDIQDKSNIYLYTSLDGETWYPYSIQVRSDNEVEIEDTCKPLHIAFTQDGRYFYTFDSNLKFRYIKLTQDDNDQANYNIILLPDVMW